mgnify:FL=1
MSIVHQAKDNPLKLFWDKLDKHQTVMLGSPDAAQSMQPMIANGAREENSIWFYTNRKTELAQAALKGGNTHLAMIDRDSGYYACVEGHLQVVHSESHIKRFWSAVASAWFPDGKADNDLTMLKFTPKTAEIWAGPGSAVKFGWEIARANISGDEPDVGVHTEVSFPRAA